MENEKAKKNGTIKISVLVPVCNVAKYLPKCLDSIIDQTLEDIEIICINDGSTDNSLDILKEYAEKDKRIILIDKKNSGYGDSMNHGLKAATGEYIGIVESDDFIAPDMFETLYSLSNNGSVDVIKSNFYNYYEDGKTVPKAEPDTDRINIPDSKKPFVLKENGQFSWGHPSVWSAIYKRSFLEKNKVSFIAAKGGGWVDNPFYYETLCSAESIMWTKKPLYYYRKTNPTSSSNLQKDASLPFVRMLDNFDMINKYNVTDEETLKCAYARALMYYTGALADFDYDANAKLINDYAAKLMERFDIDIFKDNFNLADQHKYYDALSPVKNMKLKGPRILIYNWVPYNNPWNFGGGVTVYCRNLINEIKRTNPEVTIYVLSSGFAYDATSLEIYIRKIDSDDASVHQYEIVNSPVPAAQDNMFVNPSAALENSSLKKAFADFLKYYGPFDVVHFNNIEGLSLDVMDLKQDYPDSKFIFSIHNYVPMCVHGFYYMRHKHCNCFPGHTGTDCMECTRVNMKRNIADATYERGLYGNDAEKCYSKRKWVKNFGLEILDKDTDEDHIMDFSKTAIEKINNNCDSILAVSKRVYEIAEETGFDMSKTYVSYIGTKVAERQIGKGAYPAEDGLKVVFLGNDINYEEKGYPFLLEALSNLPLKYSSKIDLVLTVRQKEYAEIYSMLKDFRSIKVYNGYKHSDLPQIFEGCNLSLVPVLWEDNLPQIAIESAAFGIPVLASSAGGASELTDSELFRFTGGDAEDFLAKLEHFVDHPEDLDEYWKHHHGLVTMDEHWKKLKEYYGIQDKDITITAEEFRRLLAEHDFLESHLSLRENAFLVQSTVNGLNAKISKAESENAKLKERIKELEKEREKEDMRNEAKVIFQTDHNPLLGEVGANLFKIVLEDFVFSDFYAEIRFINIANIAPSTADTLTISGTILEDENDEGKKVHSIHFHQFEWADNKSVLADNISIYVRENEIYFFAKHNGKASGYLYQLLTLTSRANHDSAKFERMNKGFIFENELKPEDSFNGISFMGAEI